MTQKTWQSVVLHHLITILSQNSFPVQIYPYNGPFPPNYNTHSKNGDSNVH